MVRRTGGLRRKTRAKFKKNFRDKGKMSIRHFLQSFKVGDSVVLKAEPAFQKGMYKGRFHGHHGIVERKQGFCYVVRICDGTKNKELIVHPVHLKRL
ncbi:MAG TPA: 50S ribosomal protein L21e [Candidatus Nanoarchaeia archaeon]|nr:50S ribosomal protein L21e [Candidatus Nanoarchaeia archaeon]